MCAELRFFGAIALGAPEVEWPVCVCAGVQACTGKYIARMDADDVCSPTRLRMQVDFLESHPSVAVVGSSAYVSYNDDSRTTRLCTMPQHPCLVEWDMLFYCSIVHPSVVARREVTVGSAVGRAGAVMMLWPCASMSHSS